MPSETVCVMKEKDFFFFYDDLFSLSSSFDLLLQNATVDDQVTLFDVIIIGGGVAGSSTADELSRRGKKVLLLEQFHETHARGSSHGDGRIIRYAYPEEIYLKMAEISYKGWRELERRSGDTVMTICGGIDMADDKHDLHLHELEQNYINNSISFTKESADQANARYPAIRVPRSCRTLYQPDYGVLWANKAVSALWRCAREQGATIISGCKVQDVKVESASLVRVGAADGRWFQAKSVVITAGPYARPLIKKTLDLDLDLVTTQETVFYYAPKPDAMPHTAGDGKMPILIDHNKVKVYVLPQMDLPGVKVALHHNPASPSDVDPDTRRPVSLKQLHRVSCWVKKHLPHLQSSPFHVQTCLYTNTRDLHFLIDRHPRHANVIIGSPCSGHGFKFGPAIGQILTALVLNEKPPVPLDLFAVAANRALRRTGA